MSVYRFNCFKCGEPMSTHGQIAVCGKCATVHEIDWHGEYNGPPVHPPQVSHSIDVVVLAREQLAAGRRLVIASQEPLDLGSIWDWKQDRTASNLRVRVKMRCTREEFVAAAPPGAEELFGQVHAPFFFELELAPRTETIQ